MLISKVLRRMLSDPVRVEGGWWREVSGHETKVVHEEEKLGLCSSVAKGGNGFWIFHNNFQVGFE